MIKILLYNLFMIALVSCMQQHPQRPTWTHLSSVNGDLPVPNAGQEQTSTAVFDVDNDGDMDFIITERT